MSYCLRGNYDDHVTTTEAHQLLPNTVAIDIRPRAINNLCDSMRCEVSFNEVTHEKLATWCLELFHAFIRACEHTDGRAPTDAKPFFEDETRAEKTDARDHLCCDPRRAVYLRARPATKVLVEATQPLPPLPLETNSGATANRNGKIEEVLDKVHSRLLLCRRTRSPITSEQRKDAAPEQIVGRLSLEPQVTAARWRHEAVVA